MINRYAIAVLAALALVVAAQAHAQKKIALTYDDAPRSDGRVFTGAERSVALIDALRSVEAGPVAFFVTTQGFEKQADGRQRIARYAEAGHLIANHSHTHQWAHKTDTKAYIADIDQAEILLEGFQNRRPWYRFPYLDEGRDSTRVAAIAKALDERELLNGYVTIDTYDWHVERQLQSALEEKRAVDYDKLGRFYVKMMLYAAEYYDSLAVQMLGESPVHLLLLHENDIAALYADDLVAALREAGWEIVSPDVALERPLPAPKTTRTGQGRVVGLATDAGRNNTTMWTWVIDEAMLDLALARSGAIEMAAGVED